LAAAFIHKGSSHRTLRKSADEMAEHNNITIDILIDGEPQPIFEDPNPQDNNKAKGNNFYVEVVDDARFTVQVTLGHNFDMFDVDGVLVYLGFDGKAGWTHYLKRQDLQTHRSKKFSTQPNYNAAAGQWQKEAFSFGKLHLRKQRERVPS
jgi:hypothetical protein